MNTLQKELNRVKAELAEAIRTRDTWCYQCHQASEGMADAILELSVTEAELTRVKAERDALKNKIGEMVHCPEHLDMPYCPEHLALPCCAMDCEHIKADRDAKGTDND